MRRQYKLLLEVADNALRFPIPVAGWLGALAAADLHGGGDRLASLLSLPAGFRLGLGPFAGLSAALQDQIDILAHGALYLELRYTPGTLDREPLYIT